MRCSSWLANAAPESGEVFTPMGRDDKMPFPKEGCRKMENEEDMDAFSPVGPRHRREDA